MCSEKAAHGQHGRVTWNINNVIVMSLLYYRAWLVVLVGNARVRTRARGNRDGTPRIHAARPSLTDVMEGTATLNTPSDARCARTDDGTGGGAFR